MSKRRIQITDLQKQEIEEKQEEKRKWERRQGNAMSLENAFFFFILSQVLEREMVLQVWKKKER